MKKYKDTYYSKNSFLADAIEADDGLRKQGKPSKNAEKVYADTTERMKELYELDDVNWFMQKCKGLR